MFHFFNLGYYTFNRTNQRELQKQQIETMLSTSTWGAALPHSQQGKTESDPYKFGKYEKISHGKVDQKVKLLSHLYSQLFLFLLSSLILTLL